MKSVNQNILTFIRNENAEIVCLQEFFTLTETAFAEDSIKIKLSANPYTHIHYTNSITDKRGFGIATFSRYPIINKGVIAFPDSPNVSIYSDIKIGNDTVRIYNCHLQSTRLEKEKYNFLDSLLLNYNSKHFNEIKNISSRLKYAYIKRAHQVDVLNKHIQSSPIPVILCGDFNDTPVSYSYYKLRGKMKDAYLESGLGIGNTYFGNFPSFRIDFIMHSKSLAASNFQTRRVRLSDHFPIECNFYVRKKSDK